jgi:polysaccharide export outer membrane protein
MTWVGFVFTVFLAPAQGLGQSATTEKPQPQPAPASQGNPPVTASPGVTVPAGYIIGADDLLTIRFWGDAQMSVDVVVRSDGKISVPLLNDVQAAGLTPEQLHEALEAAASKFATEPDATVIIREIRSRKVYVLGQVAKPSSVPLNRDMTVLQVIAEVGGLLEYADKENIVIIRKEKDKERRFKFNFNDVVKGRNVQTNILLQPDDTVYVD